MKRQLKLYEFTYELKFIVAARSEEEALEECVIDEINGWQSFACNKTEGKVIEHAEDIDPEIIEAMTHPWMKESDLDEYGDLQFLDFFEDDKK